MTIYIEFHVFAQVLILATSCSISGRGIITTMQLCKTKSLKLYRKAQITVWSGFDMAPAGNWVKNKLFQTNVIKKAICNR